MRQVRKAKDDVDAVLLSNLGELNVVPDSFVYLGRGKYSVGKEKKTVLLKVLNKVRIVSCQCSTQLLSNKAKTS